MALKKSSTNKMIAGVCGGIAEELGWDPTLVRVFYVLATIFSAAFPGVIVYVCLWIVMPKGTAAPAVPAPEAPTNPR
jgi:phage shock protein PspC (stress-responsive transcriptional regulator)